MYLHNLLFNDAYRSCLDFMKPSEYKYLGAVGLSDKEYNSVVRPTRVKNQLALLRVDYFIDTNSNGSAALAKGFKSIFIHVPSSSSVDQGRQT